MKNPSFMVAALFLLAGIPILSGHADDDNKKVQQLMHKKLTCARRSSRAWPSTTST